MKMGSRKYIFFLFIYLTSCFSHSESDGAKQAYSSNYYCEEFSAKPPSNRNWRKTVMTELTPEKYPLFFDPKNNNDLLKFCPNFPNITVDEKKIVLLRIIDAMVYFESSCNAGASAAGPNGTAYGLLQLHLGREQDYERNCRQHDSKSSHRSLACGLSMIYNQVEDNNKVFFEGSYWEVLRPKGRSQKAKTIASHIWYYPLCQGKKEKSPKSSSKTPETGVIDESK